MPVRPLDDRALEALLNGAPSAQSGLDWLLPFVEELEKASQEPAPVVRPALALLLKEGFTPANGTGSAMAPASAAPAATGPAPAALPPAPSTERAVVRPILRGAVARVAGLGLLAKAGMGLSLAAASTTAAGAAGVLPDPAQHAVAKVVGAATPFNFPDKASDKAEKGRTVSTDATGVGDGGAGVDGRAVSDAAKTTPGSATTGPLPTGGTPGNGVRVGPDTGATGLDRANQTPAAGHVPTSVPGSEDPPATPGSKGNGQETADTRPAAGRGSTNAPPPSGPPATASPDGNRGTTPTAPAADRPNAGTARP
ncbi:MAG TPA: hypothetical protein VM388_06430 [Acidimicrobiales bacterium]|nr:hypothetical protein [Acidimicrobiales bacterium]